MLQKSCSDVSYEQFLERLNPNLREQFKLADEVRGFGTPEFRIKANRFTAAYLGIHRGVIYDRYFEATGIKLKRFAIIV
jgi:hypothetical protein